MLCSIKSTFAILFVCLFVWDWGAFPRNRTTGSESICQQLVVVYCDSKKMEYLYGLPYFSWRENPALCWQINSLENGFHQCRVMYKYKIELTAGINVDKNFVCDWQASTFELTIYWKSSLLKRIFLSIRTPGTQYNIHTVHQTIRECALPLANMWLKPPSRPLFDRRSCILTIVHQLHP